MLVSTFLFDVLINTKLNWVLKNYSSLTKKLKNAVIYHTCDLQRISRRCCGTQINAATTPRGENIQSDRDTGRNPLLGARGNQSTRRKLLWSEMDREPNPFTNNVAILRIEPGPQCWNECFDHFYVSPKPSNDLETQISLDTTMHDSYINLQMPKESVRFRRSTLLREPRLER